MSFFNLTKIKSITKLNKIYRLLSKTYHPDNKETGDKDKFIELKEEYDNAKKVISSSPTPILINISTSKAFTGCEVNYNNCGDSAIIKIPAKFYDTTDSALICDNNGKSYIVSVKIKPEKDEAITYSRNGDIIITKYIEITPFDLIGNNVISFNLFNEEKQILLTNKLIKNIQQPLTLLNIGYPLKKNRKKRGIVRIRFKIKPLSIKDEDKKLLKVIEEKYKCQ
nr:MAG TPA: chaperone protein [Caudoviricetes sp.]